MQPRRAEQRGGRSRPPYARARCLPSKLYLFTGLINNTPRRVFLFVSISDSDLLMQVRSHRLPPPGVVFLLAGEQPSQRALVTQPASQPASEPRLRRRRRRRRLDCATRQRVY